ncbi:MAG: hypothetical protein VR70_07935 [Rhodospirillaceae bacterium BRH_c57]|nr:MAG: hypothetical protein VR70_07935 [Rhodospirillaceae bacterium BRH_c57]
MLTLQDCVEMSGIDWDELVAIAHHEHLPDMVALEKAHAFLQQEWGAPAVRQMVIDEVRRSIEKGDSKEAVTALRILEHTFEAHPGGHDRRLMRGQDAAEEMAAE